MKKIELSNQAHVNYFRTNDAVEAFRLAVTNGQARLALEMLVDVVQSLVETVSEIESSTTVQHVTSEKFTSKEEQKTSEVKSNTKTVQKKTTADTKEDAVDIED
jgi:hypothetical protein